MVLRRMALTLRPGWETPAPRRAGCRSRRAGFCPNASRARPAPSRPDRGHRLAAPAGRLDAEPVANAFANETVRDDVDVAAARRLSTVDARRVSRCLVCGVLG